MFVNDIGTPITKRHPENATQIQHSENILQAALHHAIHARPQRTLDRIKSRNCLTAWERVQALIDPESRLWHMGALQNYAKNPEDSSGLGVICAFGTVQKRSVVIIASDNTHAAGAWWPGTPEKIQRAQNMALRLRIPVLYLIESAGLYLALQEQTYASEHGAGAIFERQATLNHHAIPQLAAVFGDCIAGGGYMPLLCDKIVMAERASICIGGGAIHHASCGASHAQLGAPNIHVHYTATACARVPDDHAAIQWLRAQVETLPTSANAYYRFTPAVPPHYAIEDLYDILPRDNAKPFDIAQCLARLVDASQIEPLFDDTGSEIFGARAAVDGLPIAFIANSADSTTEKQKYKFGAILYKTGIQKMHRIAAQAYDDGIPLIWIQDVSGFEIGESAERDALLKHGAALFHQTARDDFRSPPCLTILLRKAAGAGFYAMKGTPFHPSWTLVTALTNLEVMRPDVLASALYDKKIAQLSDSDPKRAELLDLKRHLSETQARHATAQAALERGDADSFVPLSELRNAILDFARAAWQSLRPVKPKHLRFSED